MFTLGSATGLQASVTLEVVAGAEMSAEGAAGDEGAISAFASGVGTGGAAAFGGGGAAGCCTVLQDVSNAARVRRQTLFNVILRKCLR